MSDWYFEDSLSHNSFGDNLKNKKKKKSKYDELRDKIDESKNKIDRLNPSKIPTATRNNSGNTSAQEAQRSAQRQRDYAKIANKRQETIDTVKDRVEHLFDKDGHSKKSGLDEYKRRHAIRAHEKAMQKRGLNSMTTPTNIKVSSGNSSAQQAQQAASNYYKSRGLDTRRTPSNIKVSNGNTSAQQAQESANKNYKSRSLNSMTTPTNIKVSSGNSSAQQAQQAAQRQRDYVAAHPVKKTTAQKNFDRVDASIERDLRNSGQSFGAAKTHKVHQRKRGEANTKITTSNTNTSAQQAQEAAQRQKDASNDQLMKDYAKAYRWASRSIPNKYNNYGRTEYTKDQKKSLRTSASALEAASSNIKGIRDSYVRVTDKNGNVTAVFPKTPSNIETYEQIKNTQKEIDETHKKIE